ncbi:MAG: LysE family translocator [Rhodoglobus sp.]
MVAPSQLLAFSLIAIPIILIPGPGVLFIIGRSLSLGTTGGLLSVLGVSLGTFTGMATASVGLGAIIAESLVIFTVVKIAGALYLIYLGVQAIRHRYTRGEATTGVATRSRLRMLFHGFVVGVSNPKTIVFFIAVLPQFVTYSAENIMLQMLTLGALFVALAFVSDSVWALAAGAARDWFARSPRRSATLGGSGGVMMVGVGAASLFLGHERK